jgi:predicted phage terminase large subunit-like protein
VKRKQKPRVKTLQSYGLTDGQVPAGSHFKIRVYDDIITEKHVTNPEMISKALNQWELSLDLGTDPDNPTKMYPQQNIERYVGTRYHFNDPYRTIIDRKVVQLRKYPATEDGTPTGKAVFLSQEALDEKRRKRGPYHFSCQQLLNPIADEAQGFDISWIRTYSTEKISEWNIYILCDPAGERKQNQEKHDYSVILVIGLGADENYYLVDGIRDRLNLTERTQRLMAFHRKYRPLGVGYEKYGKDSDIAHIEYVMDKKNYRFKVTELGGRQGKFDRIRKLIPIFECHRFYLPQTLMFLDYEEKQHDLVAEFLNEEYSAFPLGKHDDIFDCMSRILDEPLDAYFPMNIGAIISEKDLEQAETEYNELDY